MDRYTLYLDESNTFNSSGKKVFCMAGVIIKNDDLPAVEQAVNALKQSIWPDQSAPESIVLHEKDVHDGFKGRKKGIPLYQRFSKNENMKRLYKGLEAIFQTQLITVLGATVDLNALKQYFSKGNKTDEYLIAMQLIMENYCHFLCNSNGEGRVIYEARDDVSDERMRSRFYHVKLMGSMYMDAETMKKHFFSIFFKKKTENDLGLQIADFVPNAFAREACDMPPGKFNIKNELRRQRYDGGLNLRDRFGVKKMP